MKTFSFKYNDNSNSETNVSDEYFFDINNCQKFTSKRNWTNVYGFKVNKEDFGANAKILYLVADSANIVNETHKVVFVKVDKEKFINDRFLNTDNYAYKRNIVNNNWTILFVVEDDVILRKLDKDFVYLALPNTSYLSKAKKKVFISQEDLIENIEKNKKKAQDKRDKEHNKFKETNNGDIFLRTPKYEIVEINKKTDSLPNAQVGDVIYGEMQILENGSNKLKVASNYVNYIKLYKNGEYVNTLPPSIFGAIFANNFKLKETK